MTLCRSDLVQSFRGPDLGHLSERDLSPCSPCLFRQQNGERTDVVEIDPRRLGHADRDIEAPVTFVNQPRFTPAECRRDGIRDLLHSQDVARASGPHRLHVECWATTVMDTLHPPAPWYRLYYAHYQIGSQLFRTRK